MGRNSMLYPQNNTCRRTIRLDGMWKFQLDAVSVGVEEGWADGLPNPDMVPVPAEITDVYIDRITRAFHGDFWYETDFFMPKEWRGREVAIRFDSMAHHAIVFVNGLQLACQDGDFLPLNVRITDIVRYGGINRLVILGNNLSDAGCVGFDPCVGILHSVWLVSYPEMSISDFSFSCDHNGREAIVQYDAGVCPEHGNVCENADIRVEMMDAAGKTVAVSSGSHGKLVVCDAHLWEVCHPYLYQMKIQLMEYHAVVDEYTLHTGIRTAEVKDGQVFINHRPVKLNICKKWENGDMNRAGCDFKRIKRNFEWMKQTKYNSFYVGYVPCDEMVYRMADQEGFLVINQLTSRCRKVSKQTAALMTRGKNHPCVV